MKTLFPSFAPPETWRNPGQTKKLEGEVWRVLRLKILQRDNYTCSYCGYKSEKYQIVDHIDGNPEKDAKQLKNQLHSGVYFAGQTSDAEEQRDYIYDIDLKLRMIKTILQESELFGFKNFKPIKEKIKTEAGIKAGIFSLSRKKTTEK